MNWLPSLAYLLPNLLLIAFIVRYLYLQSKNKPLLQYFPYALLFKIFAGIAVGLIYLYHYQGKGDTFALYQDAEAISHLVQQDIQQGFHFFIYNQFPEAHTLQFQIQNANPRALIMSKLIAVIHLFTQNYWLTSIYFSLFAFVGIWSLANQLVKQWPHTRIAAFIAFACFPSFVFWSSGVLKESVLIGCLFQLIAWGLSWSNGHITNQVKIWKSVFCVVYLYVIFQMKYYYLAVFLPCMLLLWMANWIDRKTKLEAWKKYTLLIIPSVLMVYGASFIHPNLHLQYVIEAIVNNNLKMVSETTQGQTLIQYQQLSSQWNDFLINIPIAFWEGLFRPYVWEAGHLFWTWTAIENLLITCLSFFVIFKLVSVGVHIPQKDSNVLIISFIYCFSLLILLALAAPNLGNLARYKTGFMPILLYMLLNASGLLAQHSAYKRI